MGYLFSVIEYRIVDYGLSVPGHQIPDCWLWVISPRSSNTGLLVIGYRERLIVVRSSVSNLSEGSSSIIGYQLSAINDG